MNYPVSIPKSIEAIVDRVRTAKLAELQAYDSTIETIAYMHGNMKEIVANLAEYTNNPAYKTKKFPIFILVEDIRINRANSDFYGVTDGMSIIIANHTKAEYKSAEREAKNFVPILRPLYQNFLKQIASHPAFNVRSERKVPHKVTERKYWGADEHTVNVLGDYIDAIEITEMNLPINWAWCNDPINSTL